MDFGFLEAIPGLDVANLAISLTPMPNYGDAGENEVGRVARNIESARLINIAEIQIRHSMANPKKRRLGS